MAKPKIFICHFTGDDQVAKPVKDWVKDVTQDRFKVFVSSDKDLPLGEDWLKNILQNLNEAEMLLVIATEASIHRPWVNIEIGVALEKGIPVVPCCYGGIHKGDLPDPLGSFRLEGIDLNSNEDVKHLADEICNVGDIGSPNDYQFEELMGNLPEEQKVAEGQSSEADFRTEIKFSLVRVAEELIPAFSVEGKNHGDSPVYIAKGGVRLKEGEKYTVFSDFIRGRVFPKEVKPGRSMKLLLSPEEMERDIDGGLDQLKEAFLKDELGREFSATEEQTQSAVEQLKQRQAE